MRKLDVFPKEILETIEEGPVVSISQRLSVEDLSNDKDQTRLGNLISEAKELAAERFNEDDAEKIVLQLEEVEKNIRDLVNKRGGLLIYVTRDELYYSYLASPVDNTVTADTLPYLLPLVANYQFSHNYHLLVLNQQEISLYRGEGSELEVIEFEDEDAPKSLEDALGTEKEGGELNHGSYGSRSGDQPQTFHGHNETSDEKDIDRQNYFRIVDNYIYDNYSRVEKIPLILYATADNQAVFRDLSSNQYLLENGIEKDGSNESLQQLKETAYAFDQELLEQERKDLFELFRETSPEYLIENDPAQIARALVEGRVEILIVNESKDVKGQINDDGSFEDNDQDFYKHALTRAFKSSADVYVVDNDFFSEDRPDFDMAARLRY